MRVASGDGQVSPRGLGDDDPVKGIFVIPRESSGKDGIASVDGQLDGGHVGNDVRPRRQQRIAV
jgi:hypothetical protein